MNQLNEIIELGPADEAARLWTGATEAFRSAPNNLVALCESLDLGIRAAEIFIIDRLQAARDEFPATIRSQLETPVPEVDPYRDAVGSPRTIQFTELLDLLGEDSLDCIGPRLHRGWEDRVFSCRRSREITRRVVGLTLDEKTRQKLMRLSAYRNRIFRYPPPVRIVTSEILDSFESLERLVETVRVALDDGRTKR